MQSEVVTGFHAVEERVRRISDMRRTNNKAGSDEKSFAEILFAAPGPRVKKILAAANEAGIPCRETTVSVLDDIVSGLAGACKEHRGLVLRCSAMSHTDVSFDSFLAGLADHSSEKQCVIVLDSVTDPHNIGAVIRSCDQFGVSLVVIPDRHGAQADSAAVSRTSAGANAWVPVASVPNLVRAVQQLKDNGFWVYGADADGVSVAAVEFAKRSVIVMGSEGSGISRLLMKQCDTIISIPTCGRLDSLNVSVAAGILLYTYTVQQS